MEKRTLGKTGMDVTVLGFGGAEIGFQGVPLATAGKLLNGALDAGLNVIDTAECYINSEELIGQTVAGRRNQFFLFTKCGHDKDGDHWNPQKMALQVDRSLQRLKTDRLDLLQLHSCTEEQLRQGDVIDVVKRARDAGKTRFIGYSGDGRAALYAVESGAFDTLQISVNIADQEGIELAIPAARAKGMGIIAKRPIANAVWKHASKPDPYHQPVCGLTPRKTAASRTRIGNSLTVEPGGALIVAFIRVLNSKGMVGLTRDTLPELTAQPYRHCGRGKCRHCSQIRFLPVGSPSPWMVRISKVFSSARRAWAKGSRMGSPAKRGGSGDPSWARSGVCRAAPVCRRNASNAAVWRFSSSLRRNRLL
jgi:hypothetical protein